MAEKTETKPNPQIEQYAFRLFADRTARNPSGHATPQVAVVCYQDAEMFLNTIRKINSGELSAEKPVGPQLDEASCPNQKPTHPLNLVSKRFGNLDRVRQINAKLIADPKIETLAELDWDEHMVKTARQLFPHYASDQLAAASN